MSSEIHGIQPVLEAIRAGLPVRRIWVGRGRDGATARLVEAAERGGIELRAVSRAELDRRAGTDRHQGVLAELDGPPVDLGIADLLARAAEAGQDPLILVLDGIEDPHNLGALIRSAWALGAHGVVIPNRRAAPVNATVHKTSAGAAAHLPVVTVSNVKYALDQLAEAGVWAAAAVMDGELAEDARLDGPLALVVGGEGSGVRRVVAERCDLRIRIGLARPFDSLNASVAGGILLHEVARQRRAAAKAKPPVERG